MSWTHLLTDVVTVAPEEKSTGYGDPCFGEKYTLRARVELGTKMVRDSSGNTVETEATIMTEVAIPRTSKVWLPEEDTTNDEAGRTAISVKRASLPGGATLYETSF